MYICKTFNNPEELVDFLNGAVSSKLLDGRMYGLHGKTLIINDGSADRTTTFADATGAGLTPHDILAQIRATDASMVAVKLRMYGQAPQRPILVVDEQGFVVKGTGTANSMFAFSASDSTVAEIEKTDIIKITASISGGPRYDVIYYDA